MQQICPADDWRQNFEARRIATNIARLPGLLGKPLVSAPRGGRPTCFETVLCDLLPVCQQKPAFGHNEPRPSVPAIVAAVGLANALSCFDATVVAFGHRSIMIPKAYLFLSR